MFDVAVIGGGLVGSAVAYGLRSGVGAIAVLDEGDIALRASRGNFGLVWLQSKGYGMGAYSRWTLNSTRLWPENWPPACCRKPASTWPSSKKAG